MAILKLYTFDDPVLRKKCKPVKKFDKELNDLVRDMEETMKSLKGVGLAAPQVGYPIQLCIVDVGDGLHVLINPEIIKTDGIDYGPEGCLSFPDIYGDVERFKKVVVKGFNRKGKGIKIEAEDFMARAVQHEVDHLQGKLFITHADNLRTVKPNEETGELEEKPYENNFSWDA